VAGYVLNPFGAADRTRLDAVVANSAAAVEALLARGVAPAMNEFNNRDIGN
jgi:peptidyl-tRNA hydrolase